jgi:AcrR family transcriptional regulator
MSKTSSQTEEVNPPQSTPDGRRQRSERSKHRIAAAMIELIMDGDLSPSAEAVARRADVGLRSVFRHFKDMDSLLVEVSNIIHTEVLPSFQLGPIDEPFPASLHKLIERRTKAFEKISPIHRSTSLQRHRSKFVKEQMERDYAMLRQMLLDVLPKELAKDTILLECLDTCLSIETWIRLRTDQKLSQASARKVIERLVFSSIP